MCLHIRAFLRLKFVVIEQFWYVPADTASIEIIGKR